MAKTQTRNGITAVLLFSVVFGMVGLAFASVPLYRLFCQGTGFGGTPSIISAPVAMAPSEKTITVRLDANVNPALPWKFLPERAEIKVHANEPTLVYYKAVNQSDGPITGTATYNVTPYKAGKYFSKIDCFCFTKQRLAAGEVARMGVQFLVSPEIFTDPNTRDVTTITLSYTFFRAPDGGGEKAKQAKAPAQDPAPGRPGKS